MARTVNGGPETVRSSSRRNKKKAKILKVEQSKDYTPKSYMSGNMKLIPSYLIKPIEFLLYLKPSIRIESSSSSLAMLQFYRSSNSRMPTSMRSKSSIFFDAKRMKGDGMWGGLGSIMSINKRFNEISREEKKEHPQRTVSLFRMRSDAWPEAKRVTRHFKIKITETSTITLHRFPSRAAIEGTESAERIHRYNTEYWNRVKTYKKTYNVEAQTPTPMVTHRYLGMTKIPRCDTKIQASYSDIFDSYQKPKSNKMTDNVNEDEEDIEDEEFKNDTIFVKKRRLVNEDEFTEACKIVDIVESSEFLHSFTSLLRIVDRTLNWQKQILFMKGMKMNDMADKCPITYDVEHLWTLRYVKVWGMPATTMCINPVNTNIIAVGYGVYFMDQPQHLGRVCIWNIKNCSQPEKTLELKDGVTCVSFSRQHPFALLVSLISGSVKLLDISKPGEIEILASCGDDSSKGPIWFTRWFTFDSGNEEPVACGENGVIYLIQKNNFNKKTFLTLSRKESILKGISYPKACSKSIPISNSLSVMCLATTPGNLYQYLVGTDDGCVHLCSTDYWHQHTDVFQAHIGPVHHIKYHPDCDKMFLTVGIDNCVRIWAFGVFDELVSLQEGEKPIEDAAWSPINPNIVVTVSSNRIMVWDLSRVKVVPQGSISSPTGARFTSILFTPNGSNIVCGDISGDIHIYTLANFPFLIKNKDRVLRMTLRRLLLGKADLIEQLKSVGHPFDNLLEAK